MVNRCFASQVGVYCVMLNRTIRPIALCSIIVVRYITIIFVILLAYIFRLMPIPVAVRSKAWVYGHSLAGIAVSNPAGCMDVCLLSVVCCQMEVSASG